MAKESEFVEIAEAAAKKILAPPLYVEKDKALLYQLTLDFCSTIADYRGERLSEFRAALLKDEVASSRLLEAIGFCKVRTHLFRTEVIFQNE